MRPATLSPAKLALATALSALSLATSCPARDAIALAPSAAMPTDSIARRSFLLVSRLASRYGLRRSDVDPSSTSDWPRCFAGTSFRLCGKVKDGEVQLRMDEYGRTGTAPGRIACVES
jgi:hypothetical protein